MICESWTTLLPNIRMKQISDNANDSYRIEDRRVPNFNTQKMQRTYLFDCLKNGEDFPFRLPKTWRRHPLDRLENGEYLPFRWPKKQLGFSILIAQKMAKTYLFDWLITDTTDENLVDTHVRPWVVGVFCEERVDTQMNRKLISQTGVRLPVFVSFIVTE